MHRTPREIARICRELINNSIGMSALEVSLDEFRVFHETMQRLTKTVPMVSLINLESTVVAQFSNISPQHFDITHSEPLTESLFGFAEKKCWYGPQKSPQSFSRFLLAEFLLNKWKLSVIFIASALVFFVINSAEFYQLMASFLLQSSTVFLSLYIIFTVSQSQTLYKDASLLKIGVLHQYYRDDRNMTLLGILTIALTFLFSGLVSLTAMFDSTTQAFWALTASRLVRAVSMSIVVALLFDTFLTVANYYLDRSRDVLERDLVAAILDDDYRKHGM